MVHRAAVALLAGITLAGCHRGAASAPPVSIALVATPGSAGDGYNDAAIAGLRACARATGATIDVAVPRDPADREPKLVLAATQNRDAIVALGDGAALDVQRAARRFETTHFAIVDAQVDEANVTSVVFKDEEGAYLAGALAEMMARHRHVGFLGAVRSPRIERFTAGFIAGARKIDPAARIDVAYAGSFTDRDAARAAADTLYAHGVEVLMSVAGPAGRGALESAAARHGVYAIGSDVDEDGRAPGSILTSVVRNVAAMTERVCAETVAQKPVSGRVDVGVADGAIGLTDFRYTRAKIGAARLARLNALRAAIVAGTIRPPATLALRSHGRTVAAR